MGWHPKDRPDGDPEALIAAFRSEIDWTLFLSTLKRTPEERLIRLQGRRWFADVARRAREERDAVSAAPRGPSGAG